MSRRPIHPAFLLAAFFLGLVPRSGAQTELQDSPFLPATGSVLAAETLANGPLQLSGISVVGKKTFVSISDPEQKHSSWIAVGQTVGGVQVVSCDVAGERAVVRTAGQLKVLTLRQPAVAAGGADLTVAGSVALSTAPLASPAANTPLTEQALQEREARMMVSDLLEIGQQQRKAYEEKKAAADAAAKKDGKS
jgi:hypothetical protein